MRFESSKLRSFFSETQSIEISSESILIATENKQSQTISHENITGVHATLGIIGSRLTIKSNIGTYNISGLSPDTATAAKNLILETARKKILTSYEPLIRKIEDQINSSNIFLSQKHYLSRNEIKEFHKGSNPIDKSMFTNPLLPINQIPGGLESKIDHYNQLINGTSTIYDQRNEEFVNRKISDYSKDFDLIERYPLTLEQKRAVVHEEDNILLIASAGSGKSSTLIAKIYYLLKEGRYKPSDILAFAYNKEAQLELSARIHTLFEKFKIDGSPVEAKTFHGFSMEVIAEHEKEKPTISKLATGSKRYISSKLNEILQSCLLQNNELKNAFLLFQAVYKNPEQPDAELSSLEDYIKYLRRIKGKFRKTEDSGKWHVVLMCMDGVTEVKSLEELRIANWLFINGIEYRYEERYIHDTADQFHRQYYPDFYYPEADLWHEHFALDSNGNPPKYFKNYLESTEWKRSLHKKHKTKLIETHSSHFKSGKIFDHLEKLLKKHKIKKKPLTKKALDSLIKKAFEPDKDIEIFSTFLKHHKTNQASLATLKSNANKSAFKLRSNLFIQIYEPFYEAYQKYLANENTLDFEDLIHKASDIIDKKTDTLPYKYLLVDEFQDSSNDRLRLIESLRKNQPDLKLFAVGDDWQSIYRFSGADLSVMTHFSERFGYTKELQLTETFRSYKEINDVAAEFVQKNPSQLKKTVKSRESIGKKAVFLHSHDGNDSHILTGIIRRLNNLAKTKGAHLSIFILSRYIKGEPENLDELRAIGSNLTIDWKTIHASKGLEADYVILREVNSDTYGFPSEIIDDPLLNLVLPEPEVFPHAEERRLFYVALTRAKRSVFILYDKKSSSVFIDELTKLSPKNSSGKVIFSRREGDHCPECGSGTLGARKSKYGPFIGCSNYPKCNFIGELKCPACSNGKIIEKKSRSKGTVFYACDQYPKCDHIHSLTHSSKYFKKRKKY